MAKKKKIYKKATTKKVAPAKPFTPPPQQAPGAFVEKFDDYKEFFKNTRDLFGPLREGQVEGFHAIFAEWKQETLTNLHWLAYMLATTWHETAATMKPITEYGSAKYLRSKKYWPYIGRGYVQLTWKANYAKYGIANDPDKALHPAVAAHVMIDGMTKGVFTGKRLDQYFNDKKEDPRNARRIINGLDRAAMVAGYYEKFKKAIEAEPDFKPQVKALT